MEQRNSELVYSSRQCTLEPSVYESPTDSVTNKLITQLMIKKVDRVVKKEGKFYYTPSEEYLEFVAKVKRFKYI